MKLNDYDIIELHHKNEAKHTYNDHINRYKFASKLCKGKKVLDLGCGSGIGSVYLLNSGASKVYGGDFKESIKIAKKNFPEKITGLTFFETVNGLDNFNDNFFDVVVCFEVIEHVENRHKFLNQISRVLKKSGLIIISTPNKRIIAPLKTKYPKPENIPKKQKGYPHLIEFNANQFKKLINCHFCNTLFYGQNEMSRIQISIYQVYFTLVPSKFRKFLPLKLINLFRSNIDKNEKTNESFSKKIENSLHLIAIGKKC